MANEDVRHDCSGEVSRSKGKWVWQELLDASDLTLTKDGLSRLE